MKKQVFNEYFVYEFPYIDFFVSEKKVTSVLEIKNSNNNHAYKDNYNKRQTGRNYYGKKRRYYSDYI